MTFLLKQHKPKLNTARQIAVYKYVLTKKINVSFGLM